MKSKFGMAAMIGALGQLIPGVGTSHGRQRSNPWERHQGHSGGGTATKRYYSPKGRLEARRLHARNRSRKFYRKETRNGVEVTVLCKR